MIKNTVVVGAKRESKRRVLQLGSVANQITSRRNNPQRERVYSVLGLSPTIYTYGGGNTEPFLLEVRKIG